MTILNYYGKVKRLWDELQSFKVQPTCICGAFKKCTCEFLKRLKDVEQDDKLMQFLLGLNSGYENTITNVISMDPLPTINRAYVIVLQVETQKEITGSNSTIESIVLVTQRNDNLNMRIGNINPRNAIEYKRDWRKEKAERKCDVCKEKGHTSDQCFKVIGYPYWYHNLKTRKNDGNRSRMAANVTGLTIEECTDTPLDESENKNVDANMVSSICQEVIKAMLNNGGTQSGTQFDSSSLAFANCAGPF